MPESHRIPRPALWVFVILLTIYVATTRGHFLSTDEIQLYQTTRSFVERGDLVVTSTHNTYLGRDGRRYTQYNLGQALLAAPLYAVGRAVSESLVRYRAVGPWSALAGPIDGAEPTKWSGDVEILFVNLYNAFAVAALCAVFQVFGERRLGATPTAAAAAALLLGLTTLVAAHAVGFFRHASAALFVLWALYFLLGDAQHPSPRDRCWAGVMLALALNFRMTSAISWPALAALAAWSAWARRDRRRPAAERAKTLIRELAVFAAPLTAGGLMHFVLVYVRFGRFSSGYRLAHFLYDQR